MFKDYLTFHSIEDSIGLKFNRTFFGMRNLLTQNFRNNGYENITPEQMGILFGLKERNGVYQSEISCNLIKHKPNITRMLDILQKQGYIERRPDSSDRRKYRVFLTEKGDTLANEIVVIVFKTLHQLFEGFSEEEVTTLKHYLDRIYDNIDI